MRYIGVPKTKPIKGPPVKFRLSCLLLFVATPAFAVDPTNIPKCDVFLHKYEACSGKLKPKQVHAAQKELLDAAMGMRAAASDPAKRADLERYCDDTFERMKKESDIRDCMSTP